MQHFVEGMKTIKGKLCISSCIQNMLINKGLDLTEEDVFMLCEGMNITYYERSKYFGMFPHNFLENFTKNSGIESHFSYVSSEDNCLESIKDQILNQVKNNNIVIAFIGTRNLEYEESYLKSSKREHAILIYGYDTERDLVYVSDSFIILPDNRIEIYQGATVMSKVFSGLLGYGWICLNESANIGKLSANRQLLEKNLKGFLEGYDEKPRFCKGITALKEYVGAYNTLMDLDDEALKIKCIDICYRIRYASVITSLEFICNYLKDLGYCKTSSDVNYFTMIDELKSGWKSISSKILRVGISGNKVALANVINNSKSMVERYEHFLTSVIARS